MGDLRFSETHEWCRRNDAEVTCGISQHAAGELGDLTFLEFRVAVGDVVARGDAFGELDSVKTTSELFAPVGGRVVALNERFCQETELPALSADPEGEGWLIRLAPETPAEWDALVDEPTYRAQSASNS